MNRILICLLVLLTSCCLNPNQNIQSVTIMSWNVQNLFDGVDDGDEYDEFSVAKGMWSDKLYKIRLNNLTKIIELNKPDIIAFQEIEGKKILQDINKILPQYKYFISTDAPGAIQLGLMSTFPINKTGVLYPYNNTSRLRPLLEVSIIINNIELIIINNHWKSKSSGFSEPLRISSSKTLKKRIIELKDKELLVLGDFNESYNEYQKVHKSYDTALMYKEDGGGLRISDGSITNSELYTVWPDSEFLGSYKFKGEWETIDHFLLNKKLMDGDGLNFLSFKLDNRSILLDNKGNVKKWITDYKTGYSDHLPIILNLSLPGIKTTLE